MLVQQDMKALLVAASICAVSAACGAGDPAGSGNGGSASAAPPPTPVPDELLSGSGTVLDDGDGPELCLGGILLSLPPQCEGIPIAKWDWDAVHGEESRGATTWGDYRVVGTYDGRVFTVRETGPPVYADDEELYRYENPCPEPEGGWKVADPEHNTQNDVGAASAYTSAQQDSVISWVDHLEPEREEFGPVVFVAVFTGAAERHEAELRKRWSGPLCVVARDVPTARELERIRAEVESRLPELGLELLGSSIGGFVPAISVDVVADPGGRAQAALEEQYGPGLVRISSALRLVAG